MDFKIGLAFSGGGFRASSFSLGVLSYLNEISIDDTTLLSKVHALSTVSGGTIAGARYAQGIKNKEGFDQIYHSLYNFMAMEDLVDVCLNNLATKRDKNDKRTRGLITAFADAYDTHLFNKGKFGTLMNDDDPIHLKHISFNATEFAHALQFRFQKTEKVEYIKDDESGYGLIGNYYNSIPSNIALDIRMADILAASSCFPGGFEPISFPNDFLLGQTQDVEAYTSSLKNPLGLMDGGIVDNQGIEPLLLAEQRMKRNRPKDKNKDSEENEFDLLIISDVTSPYMDAYKPCKKRKLNFFRRLNFNKVIIANLILLLASIFGLFYSVNKNMEWLTIVCTAMLTLNILLYFLVGVIRMLPGAFDVPPAFLKPLKKLLKIRFGIYENMIVNRANSLLKMTNSVFLKHIRRLNYSKIYKDKLWINRRIMNAIYELRSEEPKLQKQISEEKIPKDLIPSQAIQDMATKAAKMGTTLWFTEKEIKDGMLDAIIACGQFTMCWNLIDYINDIKKDPKNTNENHKKLLKIEPQLLEHWKEFNKEPLFLVNSMKE